MGGLGLTTYEPLPKAGLEIFKRFHKVFSLTYRRFIDIEKAETQTREEDIELALERLRSRTMAMQKSDELAEASFLLDSQVRALGIKTRGCAFNIYGENESTEWFSSEMGTMPTYKIPRENVFLRYYEAGQRGELLHIEEFADEACAVHYDYLCTLPVMGEALKKIKESGGSFPTRQIDHVTYFKYGYLLFITFEPAPEAYDIFKRFAKTFEQTYTRFLDLQKAEAQAREAQIESALEKVRSRSLGMHKSEEIKDVVVTVMEKMNELNIKMNGGVSLATFVPNSNDLIHWYVNPDHVEGPVTMHLPYFDNIVFNDFVKARKEGKNLLPVVYSFEQKNEYFKYAFEHSDFRIAPEEYKKWIFEQPYFGYSVAIQKHSAIFFNDYTDKLFSEEENDVLKRFANVFDQAYIRFLDLQKAEAQAKEAVIQLALERVRARTMAMQHSNELSETASIFFKQLSDLGIETNRLYIGIFKDDSGIMEAWATTEDGKTVSTRFLLDSKKNHSVQKMYEGWREQKKSITIDMQGKELSDYINYIAEEVQVPVTTGYSQHRRVQSIVYFSRGLIGLASPDPLPDENVNLLERFSKVFDQTYIRFLDLQKAEAQAREAIKQAALDRIRGEIASMRTAEDLNRITPIIWRELKTLDVPFIRCGVFIINEAQAKTEVYLTTPEGKSLGVLNLPFGSNELTINTVDHWRKKQVYKDHWNKEEFINWTKSMIELGQVHSTETYQGSSTPPESLNLHFIPFAQGMLYVGDISPLTEEKLQLVKTLAEAFSIAYARYEDFKNLEEAKNKVDVTLNELKAAQAQLIHAEKLASLGELTAGIAHEIKNPLNFVNNFSEISGELLDELQGELKDNNNEEVKDLVDNLRQNLEKINQHGKRADAIVKGMLLHSRGTSGEKTLTDINDLLDQYVTLAYHGLRAQNKEFNITIEKDYDKSLEKINVVPQDISRVFLNIINNAYYAAYDRKKKNSDNDFSPTFKVSTKNMNDKVEIRIADNGNGIPKDIIDKIFQPFFTTKPTGEGTGLGLSLSYDIVTKVHDGELKVQSKDGEGAEFVICLPK